MRTRKTVVVANWGSSMPRAKIRPFMEYLREAGPRRRSTVLVMCPSPTDIPELIASTWKYKVGVGAQDVSCHTPEDRIAGELTAQTLQEAGVTHVLVGHPHRRYRFGDTDEMIRKKLNLVLAHGMTPILCVGEQEWCGNMRVRQSIVVGQMEYAMADLTSREASRCMVAYMPTWTMGKDFTPAIPTEINEIGHALRHELFERFGTSISRPFPILYGGSVTAKFAETVLIEPNIDGVVLGKASLDPATVLCAIRIPAVGQIQEKFFD